MSPAKKKTRFSFFVHDEVNFVYLIVLGILLSYPLFRQGLWFEAEWLPYQLALGGCALAYFVCHKPKTKITLEGLDVAAIAFAAIYGLSILVAVDTNIAVQQALKAVTYLLIFALVASSLSSVRKVQILLRIFYWAGFAVVLYSMGVAFGTFTYKGAFIGDRIYSILEYPNIFACYTLSMLLIGLYLGERVDKLIWQAAYAFGNYFIMVGFFAARSRGAFLTMGVALLIYVIGSGRARIKILPQLFIFLASGYLFIEKLFNPAVKHAPLYYWGILIVASIPSLLTILLNKVDTDKKMIANNKIWAGIAIVVVVAIVAIGVKINLFGSRIFDFSAYAGTNTSERLIFYQDALKIIKDYPLLGTGGGGWEALYRQYQGYGYLTSQVHNHYLQVWIETGTFGLVAYLGIWVAAIFLAIRLVRKGQAEHRFLNWTLLCTALVIGIHSFGDFTLSMPAIMLMLWGIFGCLRAMRAIDKVPGLLEDKLTINWNVKPPVMILGGVFLVISILQVTALNYGNQGLADLQARDFVNARTHLEMAVRINPSSSVYSAALGEDLMFLGSKKNDPKLVNTALGYVDKAIRLDSKNPNYRLVKGKGLLAAGKIAEAVGQFEEANKLAPWDQKYADRLAETYFAVGKYYYYNHNQAKAKEYLEKAANYPKLVTEQANSMDSKYRQFQKRLGPGLTISEKIQAASKMAEQLKTRV